MNELIILGMLLGGPKHGYQLKDEADMFASGQKLDNNKIYRLLQRYLKDGWISQTAAPGERGQARRLYELTTVGRDVLTEKLAEFSDEDAVVAERFLFRVELFDCLSQLDRQRILRLRYEYLRTRERRVLEISQSQRVTGWTTITQFLQSSLSLERKWVKGLMTKNAGGGQ